MCIIAPRIKRERLIATPLAPSQKFSALYKKKIQKIVKYKDPWFNFIKYGISSNFRK